MVLLILQVMRKHQRYFPVMDRQNGQLLPAFITVNALDLTSAFDTSLKRISIVPIQVVIMLSMVVVLVAGGQWANR
jgi:hypothetical protein